jgi:hypothetical protein
MTNTGANTVSNSGATFQMFSGAFAVDLVIPAGSVPQMRTDCSGSLSSANVSLIGYLVDAGQ